MVNKTITMPNGAKIGINGMTSREAMICIARNVPILNDNETIEIIKDKDGWIVRHIR